MVRRFSRYITSVYEYSVSFCFYKPEVSTLAFRIVMFLTDSLEVSVARYMIQSGGIVSTVFIVLLVLFEVKL